MNKKFVRIFCLILTVAAIASFASCKKAPKDDEAESFDAVVKYYTANGQLDINSALEVVFPEYVNQLLKDYGGDINRYAEYVKSQTKDEEKVEINVKYNSIDKTYYTADNDNFNNAIKKLEELFNINGGSIEEIWRYNVTVTSNKNGEIESEDKIVPVVKYRGKWYLVPVFLTEEETT